MFETREQRQGFYTSKEWRALREYILANEPFCRKCKVEGYLKSATCVDHIRDIADEPELRLEISNCQPLCKECHSRKSFKKLLKTNNQANKNREKQKLEIKRLWKL